MGKKEGYVIAISIIFFIFAIFTLTGLLPNCNCFLDYIRTEHASLNAHIRYGVTSIALDEEVYTVAVGKAKEFLAVVINRENYPLELYITLHQITAQGGADVITNGNFIFNDKPFMLKPQERIFVPIVYAGMNVSGQAEFVVYARNAEIPYPKLGHVYASQNFIIKAR